MFKLGPVRVNVSKSGVGVSTGVTGARVGVRPDGKAYVHAGRHGLYFRQSLGPIADDPNIEQIAEQIEQFLDETSEEWLPAVRTLFDADATEVEKAAAGEVFQRNVQFVSEQFRALGISVTVDEQMAEAASTIHSDLVLKKAFPEHYDAWDAKCDELLSHAVEDAGGVVRKLRSRTLERLATGEPTADVIRDLGENEILPILRSRGLVLRNNPVYEMRLGAAISDAIIGDLLEHVPS